MRVETPSNTRKTSSFMVRAWRTQCAQDQSPVRDRIGADTRTAHTAIICVHCSNQELPHNLSKQQERRRRGANENQPRSQRPFRKVRATNVCQILLNDETISSQAFPKINMFWACSWLTYKPSISIIAFYKLGTSNTGLPDTLLLPAIRSCKLLACSAPYLLQGYNEVEQTSKMQVWCTLATMCVAETIVSSCVFHESVGSNCMSHFCSKEQIQTHTIIGLLVFNSVSKSKRTGHWLKLSEDCIPLGRFIL